MKAKVQIAEIVTEHMDGTCPVVTAAVCNVQHDKIRQTSWIQTFRSLCVRWLNVFQRLNLLCHPPPNAPYLGLILPRAFITKLSNDHGPPDCSLLASVVPPPVSLWHPAQCIYSHIGTRTPLRNQVRQIRDTLPRGAARRWPHYLIH